MSHFGLSFEYEYDLQANKAGVLLTDYNRMGGSAVGGSIRFSSDRFDPTARPSDQILAIISVAMEKYLRSSDQSLTCQTTADHSDYQFSLMQVLPLPDF